MDGYLPKQTRVIGFVSAAPKVRFSLSWPMSCRLNPSLVAELREKTKRKHPFVKSVGLILNPFSFAHAEDIKLYAEIKLLF